MLNFVERVEITFEETMSLIELMERSAKIYQDFGQISGIELTDAWNSLIDEMIKRNHDTATFNKVASYWRDGVYKRMPDAVLSKKGTQIYAGENNVAAWKYKDHSILVVFDTHCEVYRPLRGLKEREGAIEL